MKIIVIDQLNVESKYRADFWEIHKKKYKNVEIEIPAPQNGNIVKTAFANGTFEEIDLSPYDLILIHERDDRNTGYESTAINLGKKVVIYSDAFDEQPSYQENSNVLKINGEILYSRLEELLTKINNEKFIDFTILYKIDEELENLLKPFEAINPFKSKDLSAEKDRLQTRIKEILNKG